MANYYAGMTETSDFTVPIAANDLAEAVVSYQQNGMTVVEKSTTTFYEVDNESCYFIINLSQEDTLKLRNNDPLYIQLNLKTTAGQRMTSDLLRINVGTQAHREVM